MYLLESNERANERANERYQEAPMMMMTVPMYRGCRYRVSERLYVHT